MYWKSEMEERAPTMKGIGSIVDGQSETLPVQCERASCNPIRYATNDRSKVG